MSTAPWEEPTYCRIIWICNSETAVQSQSLHACGKNMPLIQCTGGVLPKLSQRTSFLWYSQHLQTLATLTGLKDSEGLSEKLEYDTDHRLVGAVGATQCSAYIAVIFSQGAHSSSGRMLHEQWCLGTSLPWSQYTLMLRHAHSRVKRTICTRLAGRTAQRFERQGTLLRPQISVDESGWKCMKYVFRMHMIWFLVSLNISGACCAAFWFSRPAPKRKSKELQRSRTFPKHYQANHLECW